MLHHPPPDPDLALACAHRSGLREFLVYVLASFLLTWANQLQHLDFQELIMFLQVC